MPVANISLVYPLCAMFFFSAIILVKMFLVRLQSVKAGKTEAGYYKTFSRGTEDENAIKATRHFANLFEAPVLFYVACILGMLIPVQGIIFLCLAWAYVLARVIHAYIHMGANKLFWRMRAYLVGWVILVLMWVMILVKALNVSSVS